MAKPPSSKASKHNGKPAKTVRAGENGAKTPKSAKNGKDGGAKPAPKSTPAVKNQPAPPAKVAKASKPGEKRPRQQTELEGKLIHMIAEEMAIEEAELTPDASFREDLNLDEIDIAELLMQAEAQFGVHPFNESDWEACGTIGEFLVLVSKRVEAKRSRKGGRA
ncbi:MAG: hypothetical protein EPN33_14960 [Acidobacteria bacterium]|nr:MAG: hypothetical protein EPN33_14960 [Acidobacteriota bacterium]